MYKYKYKYIKYVKLVSCFIYHTLALYTYIKHNEYHLYCNLIMVVMVTLSE